MYIKYIKRTDSRKKRARNREREKKRYCKKKKISPPRQLIKKAIWRYYYVIHYKTYIKGRKWERCAVQGNVFFLQVYYGSTPPCGSLPLNRQHFFHLVASLVSCERPNGSGLSAMTNRNLRSSANRFRVFPWNSVLWPAFLEFFRISEFQILSKRCNMWKSAEKSCPAVYKRVFFFVRGTQCV